MLYVFQFTFCTDLIINRHHMQTTACFTEEPGVGLSLRLLIYLFGALTRVLTEFVFQTICCFVIILRVLFWKKNNNNNDQDTGLCFACLIYCVFVFPTLEGSPGISQTILCRFYRNDLVFT